MKPLTKRITTLLAVAMASMLLYAAIGFLLFPVALKKVAAQELTKLVGRTVTIQKIHFNPYTMSITVFGFQVVEPTGSVILSCNAMQTAFFALVFSQAS